MEGVKAKEEREVLIFEGITFPNYPEVKALVDFFKEIPGKQYKYRKGIGGEGLGKYSGDIQVELESSYLLGAFLNLGYRGDILKNKATIRVGLKPIGQPVGAPAPHRHVIEIDINHLSLASKEDQQIFEIVSKFYEKVKDLKISKEVEYYP